MKVTATNKHMDWDPYRKRRNSLLQASDKYTLPDYPISEEDRILVLEYRRILRDMFNNVKSPSELVFPIWPIS